MTQSVPIIFTPPVERPMVSLGGRIFALAVAGGALMILVVALLLPPSPSGMGTHQGLGFQRCQFLFVGGVPCATCGMTTSYAHFVRGNWLASLYVQPMGFVMALGTGAVFWAGVYIAITGRPIHRLLRQVPMVTLVVAFIAVAIAGWAWKILIHLMGVDGWG